MADPLQGRALEDDPAEVAQGPALLIVAVAWHTGGIEMGRPLPVAMKTQAFARAPPQAVVHVPEHHQGHGPLPAGPVECQGQILVSPVAGGELPVAAAGIGSTAAEAARAAVGQHHQGQGRVGGGQACLDPLGRFIHREGSVDGAHGLGEMETAAGTAGPGPDHRQSGWPERAQAPTAVTVPQQGDLALEPAPTGIPTGVVVAEDAGHRQIQLGQQSGDPAPAVAEIPHQQQRVGGDRLQEALVAGIPLIVKVAGDGDPQLCQFHRLPRLGFILPDQGERLVPSTSSQSSGSRSTGPATASQAPVAAISRTPAPLAAPAGIRPVAGSRPAPAGTAAPAQARSSPPTSPPTADVSAPPAAELPAAIAELRRQRNAVILAHYYQEADIQDIADFIGDSLDLSRKAAATDADVIVFCGVHFMAETAKILNPGKTVLVPDLAAGCSLADACPADGFARFRAEHPDHVVVSYINCSAAVKAQSDLICTSSNAVDLVRQLPADQPILFAPDQNLGRWVARQSGRDLTLWPGSCQVHESFSEQALLQLKLEHPGAEVIAHPECEPHLLDLADFIGSTSRLLQRAADSPADSFIVLTEPGILHQMRRRVPGKTFFEVPGADGCSCNACPYMRLNTLEKVWHCLQTLEPAIELDEGLRQRALVPIQRMLEMSR